MKVTVSGSKSVLLVPENDADQALVNEWEGMEAYVGSSSYGCDMGETTRITFAFRDRTADNGNPSEFAKRKAILQTT